MTILRAGDFDAVALYEAMDEKRRARDMIWKQDRYGISMVLAMRIVRWLGRPAADFVTAAEW